MPFVAYLSGLFLLIGFVVGGLVEQHKSLITQHGVIYRGEPIYEYDVWNFGQKPHRYAVHITGTGSNKDFQQINLMIE